MKRISIMRNATRIRAKLPHAVGRATLLITFAAFLGAGAYAQDPNAQARAHNQTQRDSNQNLSELEKGNLARVAASAPQVQEVLLKEPGILVELKRLVAKEASQNGQIVDDSLLADQAIFDRLESDVVFRSIATQLLQKYGYLLPNVNPDSPLAKQQEQILKERAHKLVQVEAQEDSEKSQPYPRLSDSRDADSRDADSRNAEDRSEPRRKRRDRNCDPARDNSCDDSNDDLDRTTSPQNNQGPDDSPYPRYNSPNRTPSYPDQRMQARAPMQDSDQLSYSNMDNAPGLSGDLSDRAQDALPVSMRSGYTEGLPLPSGKENFTNNLSPLTNRDDGTSSSRDGANSARGMDSSNRRSRFPRDNRGYPFSLREVPSVAMIHKNNPYADVPSLYDMYVQAAVNNRTPERFGLEVFRNGTRDTDAIPMDLPAGPDYVVGPGDGLSINLWGGVSGRMTRVVDREGRINLPEAGPLQVSGKSLGDVQSAVEHMLRTQYRDTSADVSLAKLRTIRVYVVGEVAQPGAYDVSSLSTPLSALFEAGGVTPRGSLRRLQHFRGKQLIEDVDAYDLLLRGVNPEAQRLENGDSLLVKTLGPEITVTGMVRRPAVYELNGETSLEDAVELAGGILPAATLKHVEVQRLVEHEKRTMLSLALPADGDPLNVEKQLAGFKIQAGDEIHIFPIAPYNESIVYLQGHVLRPGKYSYHEGMKLTDVLGSYKDLLPEPSAHYGEIIRLNAPDFHPSVESFDLTAAMADPSSAPKLQPMDTVRIFSRFAFEAPPEVSVNGDVRMPGIYRLSGEARLRDAIFLAGGVAPDASLESAQLFRSETDGTMKIFSVNLSAALSGSPSANILLSPRDRLLIHHNLSLSDPATVSITGQVAKPGKYPLTSNMHLQDLIQAAGGLKRSADPQAADLTRYSEGDSPSTTTYSSPVLLSAVMESDSKANIPLKDGDVLSIRETPGWNDIGAKVTLRGEVVHSGSYGIRSGERLSTVLERAGGFGPNAAPYGAVLMRREVREVQAKAHIDLIERIKVEETHLRALPETDTDAKNAKLTALAQSETTLTAVQANPPIGRVVIHIQPDMKSWRDTQFDPPMRDGDVLIIPKKSNVVMVTGQVFNPTAVSYRSGRSAKWYLSQAGGLTAIADKGAVFVVRADGSVISSKNNSGGLFAGNPLDAPLRSGDTIVVPERALRVGTKNWQNIFQSAQLASSIALTVAYLHP
jgi:protein involved in polysaccharide export with SLBB domain